jgi:hypothetical protein
VILLAAAATAAVCTVSNAAQLRLQQLVHSAGQRLAAAEQQSASAVERAAAAVGEAEAAVARTAALRAILRQLQQQLTAA